MDYKKNKNVLSTEMLYGPKFAQISNKTSPATLKIVEVNSGVPTASIFTDQETQYPKKRERRFIQCKRIENKII